MASPPTLRPARLDHLALHSAEPERLAEFYEQTLGYERTGECAGAIWLEAEQRRLSIVEGERGRLAYAAFRLASFEQLRRLGEDLQSIGVSCERTLSPVFAEAFRVDGPGGRALIFGVGGQARGQGSPAAGLARLQHVVFAGPDVEAFTDFLVRVGFAVSDDVRREDGALTARFLRSDGEHHSVAGFLASECRLDHHCYETASWNDLKLWSDHLAANGVPLEWGPGRHGPGNNLFVMFKDVDGNWIELSAELERVGEGRAVGVWPHAPQTLNKWGKALMRV